jgi:hypothetical protein
MVRARVALPPPEFVDFAPNSPPPKNRRGVFLCVPETIVVPEFNSVFPDFVKQVVK